MASVDDHFIVFIKLLIVVSVFSLMADVIKFLVAVSWSNNVSMIGEEFILLPIRSSNDLCRVSITIIARRKRTVGPQGFP